MSEAWDEPAWRAVAAELQAWEEAGRVATFWWRDDDAGPPHPAFERLLALAAAARVPLGLAVVPAWLSPDVTQALRRTTAPVRVLQHGFAHANHEAGIPPGQRKGRPAECGAARPAGAVLEELTLGQARLRSAVGDRWLAVLVPPWNRIAAPVLVGLPGAGYGALSAFGPRLTAFPAAGLLQVNCHADPIVWREAKRFVGPVATLDRLRTHLAARRAGLADSDEPTGLLTHHRDMKPAFWVFLEELLTRLRDHPAAAFPPLTSLFSGESRER